MGGERVGNKDDARVVRVYGTFLLSVYRYSYGIITLSRQYCLIRGVRRGNVGPDKSVICHANTRYRVRSPAYKITLLIL